ncbi:MAG: CinA family protein [Gammaproteobacteria bacterium]
MTKNNTEPLLPLLEDVAQKMISARLKLATAESCTGGWVAKAITDLAGSSRWFECGLVTYSNQSKQDFLGVDSQLLEQQGAVSQAVVKAMVLGLLDRCNADMGISISGIAGPEGGSEQKPVGTVWIAWAKPGQLMEVIRYHFQGDRSQVRQQAVIEALSGVLRLIEHDSI